MAQRHRPHRLLLLLLLLLCTTCATTAARHGPRRPHHPPHHLHHDKYRCGASAAATAALHSPPPGTTAESAAWGYRFRVANASAVPPAASGGVTVLNRGTLFVPHAQVAPEAYAPYAVAMAARARVAVVVRSGRREAVEAALAGSPEVTSWALVAHGPRAGAIAARVAADRAEAKPAPVVQLALLASGLPESRGKQQQHRKKVKEEEEEVDLSGSYVGVFFYYGDTDTVVPPASLQAFASRLPGDAYIAPTVANASHFDFAYSTCTGNAPAPASDPAAQALRSAAAGAAVQASLYDILRFPWAHPTQRALHPDASGSTTNIEPSITLQEPEAEPEPAAPAPSPASPAHHLPAPPRRRYLFRPPASAGPPRAGLVYFGGAAVPARAYFPLARALATSGLAVALLDVPARATTTPLDVPGLGAAARAATAKLGHAAGGVRHWAVGGHSRGAAAAGLVAAAQVANSTGPGTLLHFYAVVLHGGVPPAAALRNATGFPVLAVYGTLDAAPARSDFSDAPGAPVELVPVAGGNHRQVGDYDYAGPHTDPDATLSVARQQDEFAAVTVRFLDRHVPTTH